MCYSLNIFASKLGCANGNIRHFYPPFPCVNVFIIFFECKVSTANLFCFSALQIGTDILSTSTNNVSRLSYSSDPFISSILQATMHSASHPITLRKLSIFASMANHILKKMQYVCSTSQLQSTCPL